jgi:hypothetical protein
VNSYTITITADDDSTTTTTLRLDMSGSDVRLTDLHMHAGKGLPTRELPAIDYGMLLRAITSTTPTPITAAPPAAGAEVETAPATEPGSEPVPGSRDKEPRSAPATIKSAAAKPAVAKSAATKRRRAAAPPAAGASRTMRRATAGKAVPAPAEPAMSTRTRRAAANKAAPTTSRTARTTNKTARSAKKAVEATAAKKPTRAGASGTRVYRRMPDDFAAVYQQAGSAAAVADHYDVPRHTANGWIRRLRDQGSGAGR